MSHAKRLGRQHAASSFTALRKWPCVGAKVLGIYPAWQRKIPFNSVGHLYHQMETNCEGDKVSYTVGQRIKGVVQGLSRVAWSCLGSFTVKG